MKFVVVFLAVVVCALAMPYDKKDVNDKTILHGILCGGCKKIVEEGEKLGADAVKGYVDGEIDELCSVASFLAHECKKELDGVVDKLVADIIKKLSPDDACKDCDMC
uniref:Saposin B-type domain-containing protein n=1 Tax=Plectus sambesii TaxID=2011161 RepID=A0A914V837_9BILA